MSSAKDLSKSQSTADHGLLFQQRTTPADIGIAPPTYSITVDGGMQIEHDFSVTLKDRVRIYIDIYRPEDVTNIPVLIA